MRLWRSSSQGFGPSSSKGLNRIHVASSESSLVLDHAFAAAMATVARAPPKDFLLVKQEWAAIRIQTAFRGLLVKSDAMILLFLIFFNFHVHKLVFSRSLRVWAFWVTVILGVLSVNLCSKLLPKLAFYHFSILWQPIWGQSVQFILFVTCNFQLNMFTWVLLVECELWNLFSKCVISFPLFSMRRITCKFSNNHNLLGNHSL